TRVLPECRQAIEETGRGDERRLDEGPRHVGDTVHGIASAGREEALCEVVADDRRRAGDVTRRIRGPEVADVELRLHRGQVVVVRAPEGGRLAERRDPGAQ